MTSMAPWITVGEAREVVAFYEAAFDAVEITVDRLEDEDDGQLLVAHLSIDGCDLWVQHDPDLQAGLPPGQAMRMILSVDDPDAVFTRALAAGATEVAALYEGHGWRIGRVADPAGHHWEIGKRL